MSEVAVHMYQDVHAVSNILRKSAAFESIESTTREQMIYRLSAEVLARKVDAQQHTFVEGPVWGSPHEAFLDTLPPNSFRRRFLSYWWGVKPAESHAKRRTHVVTVERWTEHPDVGIPKQSIEETMGMWA